jgi:hypothetical protein
MLCIFVKIFFKMDAKVTLSFNKDVIESAKKYAEKNNVSLSRLTETLLSKIVNKEINYLEDYPISDWVNVVAEGEVEYITDAKKKKNLKNEFFASKK